MDRWVRVALFVAAAGAAVALVGATPMAEVADDTPLKLRRFAGASGSRATNGGPQYRLPLTAVPTDYDLELDVNIPTNDSFSGKVIISLTAVRAVSHLVLHVDHDVINIGSTADITISSMASARLAVTSIEKNRQLQTLTIRLNNPLVLGTTYTLTIQFSGTLRNDMYGFYKSTYKTSDGKDVVLAATQFEPAYARSAFPCWDEPQFKAKFTIRLRHDSSLTALSNIAGSSVPATTAGRNETVFGVTPEMSTYLVAFVVSNFESQLSNYTEILSGHYRVYVRPEQVDQAVYAAEVGPKALKQLQDFTGVNFELSKLDLVAIPDFSAGAMENWGLITYRETALMCKEGESTEASKESIALVIAHEEAHMWFGDLVSPEWWGYVWLNEGFARYMQYVSMDLVEPNWNLMDTFIVSTMHGAMTTDALASSHPLSATVYTPDDIQGIFDTISYNKGGSILHMTRNVLGTDNFKAALNSYLNENKHSVATPHDLFRAFDANSSQANLPSGVSMATVLETWTQEAGFPVVTIRTADNGTATVTQERFLSSGAGSGSFTTRWWVPLTYTLQDGSFETPQRLWLNPAVNSTLNVGSGWILANINQTGFYRVNYDDKNWEALSAALRQDRALLQKVPPLNRAQLVDDALSLARAGLLRYSVALDVTRFLANETDPLPWTAALSQVSFLSRMLASTTAQESFKNYILGLMGAVYADVGFEDPATDRHLKRTFRSSLLREACSLGVEDCVQKATAAFASFKSSGTAPSPNLRSTVYCTGLRRSTSIASDWNFLWQRYTSTTSTPGERALILSALGCTTDNATVTQYLTYSLDSSAVRQQDASTVFSAVLSGGTSNVDLAFEFFKANFDRMRTSYGGWSAMQNVIEGLATRMPDESRLNKLEDFLTEISDKLGVAQAAAVRSVESARANMAWRNTHLASVSEWLGAALGSGASSSWAARHTALLSTALLFLSVWLC